MRGGPVLLRRGAGRGFRRLRVWLRVRAGAARVCGGHGLPAVLELLPRLRMRGARGARGRAVVRPAARGVLRRPVYVAPGRLRGGQVRPPAPVTSVATG